MAVGTTAFPTSLDTVVELVEITNNASSTLSGNVLIGDTTIGVTDIGEFPTTGYGTIVDDLTTPTKVEIISWTGKSGSNLTGCTRGTQGTSAAAFSSGNYIEVRPTAGHHEALRGAVIAIETKLGTGSTIAVNKLEALTASRLMVTDASGFASAASVTATEAGYLSGVTSAIQTQLGNKQGLDATLTALAAYNTNGILTQTAADTFTGRTITGTSAKIDVSNGDGVSGNPTLTISATYAGQTSITTLGTVTTGTLSTGAVIGGVTMTLGSDADGDIYYRSSGVLTRLAKGTSLQQLRMNVGATAPEWATITGGGGGDVVGPGSATDNAVSRFDGTTGKLVKNSVVTIADTTGNMAGVGTLNTHTIPGGTDTFVLLTANQTLTTKTLTSPDINGGTADSLTSLSVRSTGAAFDLLFANTEILTGNKTLTVKVNDTSRTVDLGGNLTLAAAFSTSGANALTLTTTGATNVTLPTTGTLVNSAVTSLSSLTTVGTITTGGLGTGAVIGGVTMTLGTDGTGDIYYRSAGGVLTRLAAGTNGHVLTLSSGLPAWQAAAGGGLTIGTTAITSGTAGRILYETSGNVVGETAGFTFQPAASPNLTITAQAASYVGLRINSAATPSVDIAQFTDNGTVKSGVNSLGNIFAGGASTAAGVSIGRISGFSGVWMDQASPSTSNYAFLYAGGAIFNTPSATTMDFRVNNSPLMSLTGTTLRVSLTDTRFGNTTYTGTMPGSPVTLAIDNAASSLALLRTDNTVSAGDAYGSISFYGSLSPYSSTLMAGSIVIEAADTLASGDAAGRFRLQLSPKSTVVPVDRYVVNGRKTLTDASTNLFEVALPTLKGCMGTIRYEIYASDGTDIQVRRGEAQFSAVNKAGVYTTEIAILNEAVSASSGTLTATFAVTSGTNKITISVTPSGSLTETIYYILYTIENNSEQAITLL